MHRRLRVFIFLVFAVLYTAPWQQSLWAASLKKVLILDFKNLDKNPNYDYLETSITDAVRTNLQEKFAFNEMPQSKWQSLAKDNFFLWAEDNYSRSVGLNLGVRAKQDIVVGGYYQAVRNAYGRYIVRAHVFVLDVGKRKIVTEFSIDMPADATLFDSVEKLATRVVKEAKAVLPNKGDVDFSNIEEDVGPHEIGILGGISPVSLPDAFTGDYATTTKLNNKDVPQTIGVYGSYRYHDLFLNRLTFDITGGAQFGSTNLQVANDVKKAKLSVTDYSIASHIGYRLEFWRFGFMPLVGGGFSLASLTLDYSALSSLPVDTAGRAGITSPHSTHRQAVWRSIDLLTLFQSQFPPKKTNFSLPRA
ncbi:MAG: hypothetical protein LDLANPLL_02902 [Turneriella sp.]|nr:hypothetical protein [Turneriella sp.]